jgi:hypothetical protein
MLEDGNLNSSNPAITAVCLNRIAQLPSTIVQFGGFLLDQSIAFLTRL